MELAMNASARAYYENHFIGPYRELSAKVAATPLSVLIWGPGQSGGDLYRKRKQIRKVLRQDGYAAVFSEEIDLECPMPDVSSRARELLQAITADFIVIIYGSAGSVGETHDFGSMEHFPIQK